MRILFLHHFPLDESPSGLLLQHWTSALQAAGTEVRILLVSDPARSKTDASGVRSIVCDPTVANAELAFGLPRFDAAAGGAGPTFGGLSEPHLVAYREALRRHLDAEVAAFDPHVIHAQHLWIWAQLALETGVPYLANAWGPEFDGAVNERYQRWVDQGAENASRVFVPNRPLHDQVVAMFPSLADRTMVMSPSLSSTGAGSTDLAATGNELIAHYADARRQRFG